MYTGPPITTTSQGLGPAHVYGSFGQTTSSVFTQYGSGANVGGVYPSSVPTVTNTAVYPHGTGPSFQDHYQLQMQQQASSHQPYTFQSSTPTAFQTGQNVAYGQNNVPGRQQPYRGSPPPFFSGVAQTASLTNQSGQSIGVAAAPRPGPSHTIQPGLASQIPRAQLYQASNPSMYEQYTQNSASISQTFPALQQSLNPTQPQGWNLGGNPAYISPQTGATVPVTSNPNYPPQNRQVPLPTFGPPSTQTVPRFPPRLIHLLKGPGYHTEFYGFKFALYPDGPYISCIDKDSSAESAGLRAGDKIIEINGFNVESDNHNEVLEKMRGLPNEMKLFVMDKVTNEEYKKSGVKVSSSLPGVVHLKSRPLQPGSSHLFHPQAPQQQISQPVPSLIPTTVVPQQFPPARPVATQGMPLLISYPQIQTQTSLNSVPLQVTQNPETNTNVANTINDTTESLSQPEITEPDDRKLLGQWYLQPDTPVAAKTPQQSSAVSDDIASTQSTAQVSQDSTVSEAAVTNSESTRDNESRPISPDSADIQAKIFEMLKKGTPYSNFNVRSNDTSTSKQVTATENTQSGISSIGTDIVNESDSLGTCHSNAIEQRPQSQGNVDGQESDSARSQPDNDVDTKEGIRLIHTEKDPTITDSDNAHNSRVRDETVNDTVPLEISPDIVNSINLANQLDLDKNAAMNHLNQLTMHLNCAVEQEFSVDEMLDNKLVPNSTESSADIAEGTSFNQAKTSELRIDEINSDSSVRGEKNSEKSIDETSAVFDDENGNNLVVHKKQTTKTKDASNKLKVKFPVTKKAAGQPVSESPTKKLTWKKKMVAQAMAEKDTESHQETSPKNDEPPTDIAENTSEKINRKKRTSSDAQLNEETESPPTSKRGRGRGHGRGRGRGQARGKGRGSPRSSSDVYGGQEKQIRRGRGRSRARGLRVVAPAQNLSWHELARQNGINSPSSESPTVEVDIDETAFQETPSDRKCGASPSTDSTPVTDAAEHMLHSSTDNESAIQIKDKKESVTEAEKTVSLKTETNCNADFVPTITKTEPEEDQEKPIIMKKPECNDNYKSTELHTDANLLHKTERYTLSWVEFHKCKILLIRSVDGDFTVMKELVCEVFRPRKPEKELPPHRYRQYKDLNKKLKIQHIYKTKEKILNIMYKEIDPEIFEIVYKILIDKKVLHKQQCRLGIISLTDSLRLYHFITKTGTSECAEKNLQCVVPHDGSTYCPKKRELDLVYPINFNQGSFQSSKAESSGPKTGSNRTTTKDRIMQSDNTSPTQMLQKTKAIKPKRIVNPQEDVIEISSDEESVASDTTLPYVDGCGNESLLKENETPNASAVPELAAKKDVQDTKHGIINTSDTVQKEECENQNSSNMATASRSSVLHHPDLPIAPESLNAFWLMDAMTKQTDSGITNPNANLRNDTVETCPIIPLESSVINKCAVADARLEDSSKHQNDALISESENTVERPTDTSVPSELVAQSSNNGNIIDTIEKKIDEHISETEEAVVENVTVSNEKDELHDKCSETSSDNISNAENIFKEKEEEENVKDQIRIENSCSDVKTPVTQVEGQIKSKHDSRITLSTETIEISANETDTCKNDKISIEPKNQEHINQPSVSSEAAVMESVTGKFKGVKEFFNIDDEDLDLDDITLIDINGHEAELFEEGERRINELPQLRKNAKTDEEIDHAWDQALKMQRPVQALQKVIMEAYKKDQEHKNQAGVCIEQVQEMEKLKKEYAELKKYVEEHKEFLDPMPECDRIRFGSGVSRGEESDKS